VAASSEQVLFEAQDQILKRRVSLRVNFFEDPAIRTWFSGRQKRSAVSTPPGNPARVPMPASW